MAYVDNSGSQDDSLLDANGNPLSLNTASTGNIGQNSGQSGISNQTTTGQNSTGPKGSGAGPSIDKYVQANAQAIPGLANSLADNGVKQVNNIDNQLNTQKTALSSLLGNEANNISGDQSFVNNSINNATNGGSLLDSADLANYQAIQAGKNDYTESATPQLNAAAQQLQLNNLQNQNLVGSESSRGQALQTLFGGGANQYNQGSQTLDSALLQSNPTALTNANNTIQNSVKQANNQLSDIANNINTQRTNDINAGTALQNSASLASGSALSNAINGFQTNLNNQAGTYSNNLVDTGNKLQTELNNGYIDQNTYNSLSPAAQAQIQGLISSNTSLGGVNGTNFVSNITPTAWTPDSNGNYTAAQIGQAATAQNLASANAFGQLSGAGNTYLPTTVGGGYSANDLGLQNLAGDIAARQAAQTSAVNAQAAADAKILTGSAYNLIGEENGAGTAAGYGGFVSNYGLPAITTQLMNGSGPVGGNAQYNAQYNQQLAALNSLRNQYTGNPFAITNNIPQKAAAYVPVNGAMNQVISAPQYIANAADQASNVPLAPVYSNGTVATNVDSDQPIFK